MAAACLFLILSKGIAVHGTVLWLGTLLKKSAADCCWPPLFPVPAGIGWTDDTVQRQGSQVVDALHPAGTGIIEYEVSSPAPARALLHTRAAAHALLLHTQHRSKTCPTCCPHKRRVCSGPPQSRRRRPAAAVDDSCVRTGRSCHCEDRHEDTLFCSQSESRRPCSAACPQDVTLLAEIPDSAWEPEAGKSSLSKVLGVQDLDAFPLNMSLVAPNKLLLRGYFLNNSNITNGIDGMESFQDVVLWCVRAAAIACTPVAADCAVLSWLSA